MSEFICTCSLCVAAAIVDIIESLGIQPRHPLALRLRGVADGTDAVEDPTDEAEVSEAVWLVASDSHPEGVAYAPENLWEVAKR